MRFRAFTLLTETEEKIFVSVILILSQCCGRHKHPFLRVHTDVLQSKKNLRFCNIHFEGRWCKPTFLCVIVPSSLNGFTKTEIQICVFVQKRSNEKGAYNLYKTQYLCYLNEFRIQLKCHQRFGQLQMKASQRQILNTEGKT